MVAEVFVLELNFDQIVGLSKMRFLAGPFIGFRLRPVSFFRAILVEAPYFAYELVEDIKARRSRKVSASEEAWVARYDPNRLEPFE